MIDIQKLKRLEAEATKGPWKLWAMSVYAALNGSSDLSKCEHVADTSYLDDKGHPRTFDAIFIAESRNAMPEMLDWIEKAAKILKDAIEAPGATPYEIPVFVAAELLSALKEPENGK